MIQCAAKATGHVNNAPPAWCSAASTACPASLRLSGCAAVALAARLRGLGCSFSFCAAASVTQRHTVGLLAMQLVVVTHLHRLTHRLLAVMKVLLEQVQQQALQVPQQQQGLGQGMWRGRPGAPNGCGAPGR